MKVFYTLKPVVLKVALKPKRVPNVVVLEPCCMYTKGGIPIRVKYAYSDLERKHENGVLFTHYSLWVEIKEIKVWWKSIYRNAEL